MGDYTSASVAVWQSALLASRSHAGDIQLFRCLDGEWLRDESFRPSPPHRHYINSFYRASDDVIVTASDDRDVRMWDSHSGPNDCKLSID
jgi:hypothetical protein